MRSGPGGTRREGEPWRRVSAQRRAPVFFVGGQARPPTRCAQAALRRRCAPWPPPGRPAPSAGRRNAGQTPGRRRRRRRAAPRGLPSNLGMPSGSRKADRGARSCWLPAGRTVVSLPVAGPTRPEVSQSAGSRGCFCSRAGAALRPSAGSSVCACSEGPPPALRPAECLLRRAAVRQTSATAVLRVPSATSTPSSLHLLLRKVTETVRLPAAGAGVPAALCLWLTATFFRPSPTVRDSRLICSCQLPRHRCTLNCAFCAPNWKL
jgi:hypothetical protein